MLLLSRQYIDSLIVAKDRDSSRYIHNRICRLYTPISLRPDAFSRAFDSKVVLKQPDDWLCVTDHLALCLFGVCPARADVRKSSLSADTVQTEALDCVDALIKALDDVVVQSIAVIAMIDYPFPYSSRRV